MKSQNNTTERIQEGDWVERLKKLHLQQQKNFTSLY